MATSQAIDQTEPTRTRAPNLMLAWWALNHITALAITWLELEVILGLYLWFAHTGSTWWAIGLTLFVVKTRRHLDDELTTNIRATYDHYLRFVWQTRTTETYEWPTLEAPIELGEFIGWRAATRTLWKSKGQAIPFTTATFTVRRPDSKGHTTGGEDKWLAGFADLIRRRFWFGEVNTQPDTPLPDPNQDHITLYHSKLPKRVEAVDG